MYAARRCALSCSRLTGAGIGDLFAALNRLLPSDALHGRIGARAFQARVDANGQRVAFVRLFDLALSTREEVRCGAQSAKIHTLRRYVGDRLEVVDHALPGDVVGITGLPLTSGTRCFETGRAY